jgi:hypothetical protein
MKTLLIAALFLASSACGGDIGIAEPTPCEVGLDPLDLDCSVARAVANTARRSVSAMLGMSKRRIRSRKVPDTGYQYINCPDGCENGEASYLYNVVAEQGAHWYSAISRHPHAQSPAYSPGHVHRGIAGVSGVAVNHYWRGSGNSTVAMLATNAFRNTIGDRPTTPNHYVFSGIFEASELGGVKPHLLDLWQTFSLRRVKHVAGGRANDAYRILAGISWTDVQGRRYILEINLDSSDNSAGWCRDKVICSAGTHHGNLERFITLGGRALRLPGVNQHEIHYGIYWGSLIRYLRQARCDVDGLGNTSCLPSYALHFDGRNPHCSFNAGVSTETRGYGFLEIAVGKLDLKN